MKRLSKHHLFFIFLFYAPLVVCSQNALVDSLEIELSKSKEDTNKVKLLLQVCEECMDCDNVKINLAAAYKLSESLNYQKGIAKAELIEGTLFENEGKIYEALDNFQKALQIGNETGDKKIIAQVYNNSGRVYKNNGDLTRALKNFKYALKLFEEVGYRKGIATTLNNIGVMYKNAHELEKALECYEQSLKIRQEISDQKGIAESFQNIGNYYDLENDFDKALEYYQSSLKIRESINDKSGVANSLNNIGMLYYHQGDLTTALDSVTAGLNIFIETGNKNGVAHLLYTTGLIYFAGNNLEKAEESFLQSLEIAREFDYTEKIEIAASKLSELYATQKKFEKAFEMKTLANEMGQKLKNAEVKKTIAQLEFDKKESILKAEYEKNVAIAKFEIERQKNIRNWNIAGFALFTLSAAIIILFYKRRKDAEMQLEIADSRMKAMNAQLNQHFIFSSLSSIRSYMTINFDKADDYLVRFAKFVRSILNHSDTKVITLKQELEETENYMILERFRFSDKFDYSINLHHGIDAGSFLVPPLLFQPIVENSIKHGFEGIDYNGQIKIEIFKMNNSLICELSDNGKGFQKNENAGEEKRKSFGTQLTKERIEIFNKLHNQKAFYEVEQLQQGVRTIVNLPVIT